MLKLFLFQGPDRAVSGPHCPEDMEADDPNTDDRVFGVSFNGENRAYPHRTDTERCSRCPSDSHLQDVQAAFDTVGNVNNAVFIDVDVVDSH